MGATKAAVQPEACTAATDAISGKPAKEVPRLGDSSDVLTTPTETAPLEGAIGKAPSERPLRGEACGTQDMVHDTSGVSGVMLRGVSERGVAKGVASLTAERRAAAEEAKRITGGVWSRNRVEATCVQRSG